MIHMQPVPYMPPKLPPHVHAVKSKGKLYLYLQKGRGTEAAANRIRLPNDPNSHEFWAEYARLRNLAQPVAKPNSVCNLIAAWHKSPEWLSLGDGTRREWLRHCRRIEAAWGALEVRGIQPKHVLMLRDQFAATPATANNLMRCLSSMLGWSVPRDWRSDNPCREIKPLKGGKAYEPWPWDVIETVRQEVRPDLWWIVALGLYTGQRLGDVLDMRWSAINPAGLIAVRQQKTSKELLIPIHRDLREVLETIPRRSVTICTSQSGRPWKGFQTVWRKHRPAVLAERGLVFHGLRKSAVVTLLEAGCSDAEVSSITGQTRRMVEHYAKQVNQEKLAKAAILKWEAHRQ